MKRLDAIVIGAGEAGALVASRAVQAGHRVAMIYREPFGSTCVTVGCVPSKLLIHRAKVAHLVRTAARFGILAGEFHVDLRAIVAEKNAMRDEHVREQLEAARGEERLLLLEGQARFLSPREVAVGDRVLRADRIFIATGMRPLVPRIAGLESTRFYTNDDVMDLTTIPERLVVIGGGYVACELGQVYARFGSRVTVVQSHERLLPDEEPDVGLVLAEAFRAEEIDLLLEHRAERVEGHDDILRLSARASDGRMRVLEGTHLLVAAGRRPNTDGLALDRAGVATDEKGFIKVDDGLGTTAPGIWAIGDVNGAQPFTRICQEEAKVAYENAFEEARLRIDREALAHAIFTDPEISSVGLTEARARERFADVAVGYVTFDQSTKARLIGETRGFIKLVVERSSRRILGCHVIGPQAADLVYDASLVMRRGTLDDLAATVGIFPTLQEAMEGSARALLARLSTDVPPPVVPGRRIHCPECGAEFGSEDALVGGSAHRAQ